MCRIDSNVELQSLHLVEESCGRRLRVAIPRCRMFLNHECMSRLVVRTEWSEWAMAAQGGVKPPSLRGHAVRQLGGKDEHRC